MNELVPFFVLLLLLCLTAGIVLSVRNGGFNRHLPYSFSMIIYTQYLLISPFYFYLTGRKYIIGTDISEYYWKGFFFASISMVFFIVGYWIRGFNISLDKWKRPPKYVVNVKSISIIFYILYAVILINMAIGGINIQNLFLGNEVLGLGAKGESYFFQNFADSLITVILIGYLAKVPKTQLWIWIILSFFLFSLLGFRYRIILTLFGLLFCYTYTNKLKAKQIVLGLVLLAVFFYATLFLTENRGRLIRREYADLVYNPARYSFDSFFEQTRGGLADLAVYKLYDNPNKTVDYDYGLSMFGYIFIRMIPRTVYPDKDRFYPPPQNKIVYQAYDAWWGKFSGEATLSTASFYIGFGWLGLIFGHFFSGLLLRIFSDRIIKSDILSYVTYVVIALVSFQWITRGYFPQIVDHAVYMLAPVWIVRLMSKNARVKISV